MDYKTSWSTDDLKSLTKVENHKFMFDGYEYTWLRKLKDEWEIHYIRNFTDRKKALAYLKYNISKWTRELNKRLENENRRGAYKHIEKMLDNQEKIYDVYNVAPKDPATVNEIANIVLAEMGIIKSDCDFKYTGGARGWKGDVPIVRLDTEKIRSLGWKSSMNSIDAIKKSVSEMKGNLKKIIKDD